MVVSCSDNPNNHNHLKHCIAKLQLRVELMHSVVQRQQWQAKSIMEWSLRQLQMYLNAKHIVYKTIYGYLGIPDSGNWSSNNDLLLYRSPPSPSGGSWGQKSRVTRHDRSRDAHTISDKNNFASLQIFSPPLLYLVTGWSTYPRPHTGCWTRCSEWT